MKENGKKFSMVKKLITRKKFSELVGTSQANVTKLCKNGLKAAVVGSKIDLKHLATVNYMTKRDQTTTPEPLKGVDPLYEDAIKICQEKGKWNTNTIQKGLGVGNPRAKKLFAMIKIPRAPHASTVSAVPLVEINVIFII